MVESMSGKSASIYLVNIPLEPANKIEIQELQTALIIATLSDPRIYEILGDPVESVLFVDNLFVATAALAREKAGYSISEIAEELGRSETTIRAHLEGATKIGRIVRETYETLRKLEELSVSRPNVAVVTSEEVAKKFREIIKDLEYENSELRKTVRELDKELRVCWSVIKKVSEVLKEY